ncbi:MAG: putative molybdenum carrier protein [Gemmataceae bacterium]|nr:putative molybdenum carrier protein [Gemmataceae bacterium]MCS7269762.1 putative molybdenum carrier protein [Gemmataceae bacterium]MDW8242532.1 putative molybdenum carrier protein [Thermogemmata sp.]
MAAFELKRVISGGQTGADIGGLKAAKACGIPTGGWMPKGFLTEDGPRPEYERLYGMFALSTSEYNKRTRRNVEFARGTLCIARRWNADGVAATIRYAEELNRPLLKVPYPQSPRSPNKVTPEEVYRWLVDNNIFVLNVAGNRESNAEGIEQFTYEFLVQVFQLVRGTPLPEAASQPGLSPAER